MEGKGTKRERNRSLTCRITGMGSQNQRVRPSLPRNRGLQSAPNAPSLQLRARMLYEGGTAGAECRSVQALLSKSLVTDRPEIAIAYRRWPTEDSGTSGSSLRASSRTQ